jgi:xanthine dehydrogenase YagT iron-sulfur-binding subunit
MTTPALPAMAGSPVALGAPAPDLLLASQPRPLRLRDFRGRPVVLALFDGEWDPARHEHLALYHRILARLPGAPAELLALPVDGDPCRGEAATRAWASAGGAAFYLIDADGIVRWRHLGLAGRVPRADEMVAALAALAPASPPGQAPALCTASRREFVALTLLAKAALATPPSLRGESALAPAGPPPAPPGPTARPVTLRVNGRDLSLTVEPQVTLLDALREYAGLPGTKKGCDHGQCGACTVHLDGRRVLSCLTLAMMAQGHEVTTIEGLARNDTLHPMQAAFIEHDGFQCGYCTPGQIMSATALLDEPWGQSDDDVREAMSGNICRCGAYPNIVAAVQDVRRGRAG